MDNLTKRTIATGIISGFAITCLQIAPGPIGFFEKCRDKIGSKLDDAEKNARDSEKNGKAARIAGVQDMLTCGWCAAPFIVPPVFALIGKALKGGSRGERLVSGATAVGIAGFLRHFSDVL